MLATFFTFSPSDITAILGYIGNLISDAMPLIVVILGIGIGAIILKVVFDIIRR